MAQQGDRRLAIDLEGHLKMVRGHVAKGLKRARLRPREAAAATQVGLDPADWKFEMSEDRAELLAALTAEVEVLEQLRRRYSELALLTKAAEYRCLSRTIDEIAVLEAELGIAELARAVACHPFANGTGEATGEELLAGSRGGMKIRIGDLITEMRRLYLDVVGHRSVALEVTDERLAHLAGS